MTPSCTHQSLTAVIARFGGTLAAGLHPLHDACCVLEARSVCLGLPWTDDPAVLDVPDIRPLNDGLSDDARTEAMIRLVTALDPWATWSHDRQRAVATRITIETVRQIVADLPGLPPETRHQCREVTDLAAAWAAAWAAAGDAAWAAAGDAVLIRAVDIWITACEATL